MPVGDNQHPGHIAAKYLRGDFVNRIDDWSLDHAAQCFYYQVVVQKKFISQTILDKCKDLLQRGRKVYCGFKPRTPGELETPQPSTSYPSTAKQPLAKKDKTCEGCNKSFTTNFNLKRHISRGVCKIKIQKAQEAKKQPRKKFFCDKCGAGFTQINNLITHIKKNACRSREEKQKIVITCGLTCDVCKKTFSKTSNFNRHKRLGVCNRKRKGGPMKRTEDNLRVLLEDGVWLKKSAFNDYAADYGIPNDTEEADIKKFMEIKRDKMKNLIEQRVRKDYTSKLNILVESVMQKMDGETKVCQFKTSSLPMYEGTNLDEHITFCINKINQEFEDCVNKGSGWTLQTICDVELQFNKFQPVRGKSYLELPVILKNTGGFTNPQNFDERCIQYAIAAYECLRNAHDPKVLKKYIESYDWTGISFPTPVSDIVKFEKNNPDVSVNLYALDEDNMMYPLRVCDEEKVRHRDLLLLEDEDCFHYVLIKNFSRAFSKQINKTEHAKYVCKKCLSYYDKLEKLADHKKDCSLFKTARIVMPALGVNDEVPTLQFEHVQRQIAVPITIYVDFECVLEPMQGCANDPSKPWTLQYQEHKVMSYALYCTSTIDEVFQRGIPKEPEIYRGPEPTLHLLNRLMEITDFAQKIYEENRPMSPLTTKEQASHDAASTCYLCNQSYSTHDHKVRDHCHVTGKYRGPAHNQCNLLCRNPNFVPVIIHNLSGYDAHFIIRELDVTPSDVGLIPHSEEKYITFSKKVGHMWLRFIDSFKFMSSGLDTLARNLPPTHFNHVSKFFPSHKKDLVIRKGVFCYDFVDSLNKLKLDHLPPKEHFHNKLYECDVSEEDYTHAQQVWDKFNCKTLGEYSDLYLKVDVLLLADVFENFRVLCLNTYQLDPCWYFTVPGLAWDAALKYTKISLELLTDYDMHMMLEKGIRGGITQCCRRYAEARNKYTHAEATEDQKYIMYLDANNLYGWAMSKYLPFANFEMVDKPQDILTEVLETPDDADKGYILEVDVSYPQSLHDKHNDLPYLPEKMVPPGGKHEKLLTTLYNKQRYVVHYVTLKQSIAAGLIVDKVHRIIKFSQAPWLKSYIDLNTELRKNSNNNFEKDFFKLMNNAVFGKTMENVRNRMMMELVLSEERLKKVVRKPAFLRRTLYKEGMAAVHSVKNRIVLDKPIYVGQAILDLSKTCMYNFHYNTMQTRYEALELLYMDTDSFLYLVHTQDFYEDMANHLHNFDTSDYPAGHICQSNDNKKVLGKMKDEANGVPVLKFVGLRPKLYAMEFGGNVIKKIKGVKKTGVKKLKFEDFKKCLVENCKINTSFNSIRSIKHRVFSIQQNKLALCSNDDKRFIREDGISTYAYGHFKIVN